MGRHVAHDAATVDLRQVGGGLDVAADQGGTEVDHLDGVADGLLVAFQVGQDELARRLLHVPHQVPRGVDRVDRA